MVCLRARDRRGGARRALRRVCNAQPARYWQSNLPDRARRLSLARPRVAGRLRESRPDWRASPQACAGSLERVKFFKLAWDAIGSEFGSRHLQYEMFHSGAPFVINGHNFRFHDWAGASGMVQEFMDSYATPGLATPSAANETT